MVEPLCPELFDPLLQVGLSLFQHRTTSGITSALELFNHTPERQSKTFSFAKPMGLFWRQAWPFGGKVYSGLFLLQLNGLAFPAPGHRQIIALYRCTFWTPASLAGDGEVCATLDPRGSSYKKRNGRKLTTFPSNCAYNATKNSTGGYSGSSRGGRAAGAFDVPLRCTA